jgi:hypothetical protein
MLDTITWLIRFICKFALLPAVGGALVSLGLVEVLGSVKLGVGAGILASWVAYAAGFRASDSNPFTVVTRAVREIWGVLDYYHWSRFTEDGRRAIADLREGLEED